MSLTNAHSRRQVRSLVPVLRGIGRRAARGGVGWKVRTVGGVPNAEGGSSAYLTLLSRLEHLARSLCPKGLHLACSLCPNGLHLTCSLCSKGLHVPKVCIWHVAYAPKVS